jgi:hypothetical protein
MMGLFARRCGMAVNDGSEPSQVVRSGEKNSSLIAAKRDTHGHLQSTRCPESWHLPCD